MSIYREKLWPAPWLFLASALVIPASLLVFVPIDLGAGIITAIVLYTGICVLLLLGAPTIEMTSTHFSAGKARLPVEFIGTARAFTGEEATLERGQHLDARAWLLIRGWVSPVVTVEVRDERDATPYWLVSTRHPAELVAAIEKAVATHQHSI